MAGTNPLLDDIAGLMTGALGAARAAGEEAKTAAQARVRALIADMDLAGRDEVEALKAIAVAALERAEALEARVAELEAAIAADSPES
ncbi:accessory factor UbiK family protein [Hyphomonas sp.]|uniref:accessory factor UbiK family protein n=1 Tax=Hyphomonas sp. TaxID=87 RepID=UPI00391BAC1C